MKDRLHSLMIFRRTARLGSFSRAARELGVSQASVSRTIAELERALGVTLLARTTRAVSLTERGAEYLARIDPILDALSEADHAARGDGALRGLLRIGMSASFGVREIIPRLPEFLALHPNLRLEIVISDARQDLIAEGIDLTFRLGALADSNLRARHLATAMRLIVAAPRYLAQAPPIAHPGDLARHTMIVGPGITAPLLSLRKGESQVQIAAEGRITCGANEGVTALAKAGLGLTVSSHWGISQELAEGALVQVLPDWSLPSVPLHAVFPPGRSPSAAARLCADHIARSFVRRAAQYAPDGPDASPIGAQAPATDLPGTKG